MRNVIAAIAGILLISACANAFAQCSALVREGLFETVSVSSDNVSISAFMNWVRDHRTGSTSSNTGGGISIPIVGSLNGSFEQYSQMESDYAAANGGSSAARSRLTTLAKTVSTALAQRFNECMSIKGLHVWLETTDDPYVFKLATVFNSPGPAQVSAKIDGIGRVPSNLSCDGAVASGTTVGGSTRRMICTRKSRDAVTIVVNADTDPLGGGELKLAAVPIPNPTPVIAEATCNSSALVSRGASASHPRMTDGIVQTNVGVNSGRAGGSFWVELSKPEWIHHVVLYPIQSGAPTAERNTVVGYRGDGAMVTFDPQQASATNLVPIFLYLDLSKSKEIKKIEVNTDSLNGRDWIAWSEWEIFACR